ncbi:MAG: hypothetical protein KTR32_33515 [Granulosicoccus sp.]|nr:hypothetical protein [Granulosicoccus sp.]
MKILKVFLLFSVLHLVGWVGAHWYRSANPDEVLLVVDTSISMKPAFPKMQEWITDFEASGRYQTITVGTDKAEIGRLDELKSKESIFRTVYGRMTSESLQRYESSSAATRILLSDGSVKPAGWTLVEF